MDFALAVVGVTLQIIGALAVIAVAVIVGMYWVVKRSELPGCKRCFAFHHEKDCPLLRARARDLAAERKARRIPAGERFDRFRNHHLPWWMNWVIERVIWVICRHKWEITPTKDATHQWWFCRGLCRRTRPWPLGSGPHDPHHHI